MKKVLFLLAVSVMFLQISGFSQKAKVGVAGGYTSSNMSGTVGGVNVKGDSKAGFTLGMLLDAPIGKSHFSFQPGVHYVQKGKIISETNKEKSWLALRYVDLQLNFLYNSKGKTNFFIGVGPTLSFDMPSKSVVRTSNITAVNDNPDPKYSFSEKKINFGKDVLDDYHGLDYGANLMAGFKLRCGFLVSLNYTFGLRNIIVDQSGNNEVKNGYAGFRFGWLFNNK